MVRCGTIGTGTGTGRHSATVRRGTIGTGTGRR